MAVNSLSHNLLHISARPYPEKSSSPIFCSLSPPSFTSRLVSLKAFAFASPSPLNRRTQVFMAAAAEDEAMETEEPQGDADVAAEENSAEEKPPRQPRIKLGEIMGILNKRAIEASEQQRPVPDIRTGDIVEIKLEVPENRKRLSVYKGIVMSKQNAGIHTTIRIRRVIAGIGVEIVFPIYSPNIKEIKVVNHRKVRRARLYYLREKLPRFSTFKFNQPTQAIHRIRDIIRSNFNTPYLSWTKIPQERDFCWLPQHNDRIHKN